MLLRYKYRSLRPTITTNEHKAMDSSDKNATMFLSNLREWSEFYNLFSSFNDDEISPERRDIILENIRYNIMKTEKEYMAQCETTVRR